MIRLKYELKKDNRMKKILIAITMIVTLVSCQKEPTVAPPQYDAESERMWKSLDGSYTATFYVMHTDAVWYRETITFSPAEEPFKKSGYTMFGTATIYDRYTSFENTGEYYYSFTEHNSKRTITFYKTTSTFSQYEKNIADVTELSFRMWDYGLTEAENSMTYYKN